MRISPKFTDADWKALDLATEPGWKKAVDIFEDRIHGRFLNMIEHFERMPFAGFAVLALDCLLTETLQQFRSGVDESPRGKNEDFFVAFLTTTRFKSFFEGKTPNFFYRHIRCGILHQAEVKGNSRVVITGALVRLTDDKQGIVVNRRAFHRQLLKCVDEYAVEVRKGKNDATRKTFRRKMDYICRQPPIPA